MSLIKKSDENYRAFLLLKERGKFNQDQKFHAPAIHCCYYSCFQKAIYILKNYYEDEFKSINSKASNSHSLFIRAFISCYSNISAISSTQANRYLKQLKTLRQKADYEDDTISESEMEKAEEYLTSFNKLLKKDLGDDF